MKRWSYAEKHGLTVWWLRYPNVNNANNVNYVSASGSLTNNNANNAYGFAPDYINSKDGKSKPDIPVELHNRCKEHMTMPRHSVKANQYRRRRCGNKQKPVRIPDTRSCIFSYRNLVEAAFECAKGVKWKNSVIRWCNDILPLCLKLRKELLNGKYKLTPFNEFTVTRPKPRVIRAQHFRDRVVQRVMCNCGLYYDLTKDNIYDNGACQKGKGTSFALERFAVMLRKYQRRHGNTGYVLQLDIRKFFDSIPHDRLKIMVRRKVRSKIMAEMVCDIIDSYPGDRGIGLGSQISQLLAINYLSDLDHKIKEQCGIKYCGRYSDDLVLVHPSKEHLQYCWKVITSDLADLGLILNPKSTLHKLEQGISYLHFKFTVKDNNVKYYLQPDAHRSIRRYIRHLRAENTPEEKINQTKQSWCAFAVHGGRHRKIYEILTV